MKYQHTIAAGLCSLTLLAGFADAVAKARPIKLRKSSTTTETLVDLTPEGAKLEA